MEHDPPELAWRPLRVVYSILDSPGTHLWATHEDDRRVWGFLRPAAEFEDDHSQGFATRLPTELRVGERQRVVRLPGGAYVARDADTIAQERRLQERLALEAALVAMQRQAPDDAKSLLDQALLLGSNPPFAAVLRRGLAEELPPHDPWRQAVIEEYAADAGKLEIEIVAKSLWWDDLPAPELRLRWLQHAYAALALPDGPQSPRRAPVAPHYFEEAAYINTAIKLGHLKTRLRHHELALLVQGDPSTIDSVAERLQALLGVDTREALVAALKARITGDHGELLRSSYARARATDLTSHATVLARLEATLGEAKRANCWRAGLSRLNRIKLMPRLIPWQQGQTAAEVFRAEWQIGDSPIPTLMGLFREDLGWAAFSTDLHGSEYDGFHVIRSSCPPTSYLDPEVAQAHGPARFAVARALGMYLLSRVNDGRWFSRRPDSSSPSETTETEQAAKSFAAYLLAPRRAVGDATGKLRLNDRLGYREAVREVATKFGMSVSASFAHVANCRGEEPRFEWRQSILSDLRDIERSPEDQRDTIEVPVIPAGENVPLERANGFASLVARGIASGMLSKEHASELLGSSTSSRWFTSNILTQQH